MVVQSTLKDVLPSGFGYVAAVAVGASFLNVYFVYKVVKARKEYEVEYPAMYSDNNEFNCIQRVHQNYLENYPMFMTTLMLGGVQHPRSSAAAGLLWLISRVVYAQGYYTGDPDKRKYGGIPLHVAELVLLGNTTCFAVLQTGCTGCFGRRWG